MSPMIAAYILASFTAPENIGTTAQSMLWLLPLAAAIAITYKATKIQTITADKFTKEALVLFGSIIVFIITIALGLHALAWLITE